MDNLRFICFAGVLLFYLHKTTAVIETCDSKIYCQGKLLDTIQMARINKDSKPFVDMILKNSQEQTLKNFDEFMQKVNDKPSVEQVRQFVAENFDSEGELDLWKPSDHKENPAFLTKIRDPQVKLFAENLTNIWPKLGRKMKATVTENPDRHSLIPVPNGFIVPGGRFKEFYYWDSYWIVKGLIICEMTDTARGVIENFLSMVEKFGFVPNGGRVYYLNRSQPPLLSLMAGLYINATNDLAWLAKNIDVLEKELDWWTKNKNVTVTKEGINYDMVQYNVASGTPRPESYAEDVITCSGFTNESQKEYCYRALKTGAESGWDFSVRWIFDPSGGYNLTYIDPMRVIPVDVNAFFCRGLKEISGFHSLLGNAVKATDWMARAHWCQYCLRKIHYDEDDGIWYDYDMGKQQLNKGFYASNFAPLWAHTYHPQLKEYYGRRATEYLVKQGIPQYLGGIPASLADSGEQWDFPNAWPPLQEFVVQGLYETGEKSSVDMARTFAKRWINANIKGYLDSEAMFEKYDAVNPGAYGGGGEYRVQEGFGWSNGVALSLINTFAGGVNLVSSKYLIGLSSIMVLYLYKY